MADERLRGEASVTEVETDQGLFWLLVSDF